MPDHKPDDALATTVPVQVRLLLYETFEYVLDLCLYSRRVSLGRVFELILTNYVIILTSIAGYRTLRYMEVDVQKLKRLREDKVLSQRELAREARLAQGTVWRIENGFSEVHPSTIRKLAEVLGVEPRELVKREG